MKVMGIVNVTPDSFSDGGLHASTDAAVNHALALLDAGADIVDVGGESTRPGAVPVDEDTELVRAIPVIERVRAAAPDAVISIDTGKAGVAEAAADAGAAVIDWLVEQPEVDASRIGVSGISMGSYWGMRIAAYDERVAALATASACAVAARARSSVVPLRSPGLTCFKRSDQC